MGTTSDCVVWQGGDVACLGIENGQLVSQVVFNVATEVCALQSMLDLSDLDLKCVFDLCISCPQPEKTLKIVLDLIINKICSLDTLVKQLSSASTSAEDTLIRLADCFQYKDINGDVILQLPHSEYTKRIANQVCSVLLSLSSLQNSMDELNNSVVQLDDRIQALEQKNSTPVTSSCLYTNTKAIEDAYELLDLAFCQLRTATGTPTDINLAIGKQDGTLNAEFATVSGWKLIPASAADLLSNLEIAFASLRSRVSAIENTCCAPSCDNVKIGFAAVLNQASDGITVRFTAGNGTSIPTGFTDAGSVMTVTDSKGNSEDFNVVVANNGTENLVLTAIDMKSGDLKLNLAAKLTNGSLVCEKCVDKTVNIEALCKFCEISATGAEGTSVTILYDDSQGDITHSTYTQRSTTTTTTLP